MADERQREFTIQVRVRYALWLGDGHVCVKTEFSTGEATFMLVDRENRFHELAPYTVGMFGGQW